MKLVILVFLIALAGCAQEAEKPKSPAPPETEAPVADAEEGKKLYGDKGCLGCHGANGEGIPGVGPALKGLYGSQVELADGTKVTADDAYILESIQKPGAKVRKGYAPMPDLGISEADAKAMLEYIKTLK